MVEGVTVTAQVSPTTVAGGASVTYTSHVTSGAGTPTGTVTFTIGATTLCTTPALVSTTANCSATNAPVGLDTVTATYNGDTNFNTNTGTTTLTVNPPPFTITTASP